MRLQPMQRAILLVLLDAHNRRGSALMRFSELVRALAVPAEIAELTCADLTMLQLAVCTPVNGPPEMVALTLAGVREARRQAQSQRGMAG